MALTDGSGLSATDILALTGNGNNGFGDMNSGWWIILLLICLGGGFWGNRGMVGNGGDASVIPYLLSQQSTTTNDVQSGFNQQILLTAIGNLNNIVTNGFSAAAVDACNKSMETMQAINGVGMQIANGNNALLMQMGNYEMARQQCCCDNKLAVADLKSTVLSENCADRNALEMSTMQIMNAMNAGFQKLSDQNYQQQLEEARRENEAARRENDLLRQQNLVANFAASQNAQTQQLYANNAEQTQRLMDYLNPPYARPYYGFQNGNGCCNQYQCSGNA